MIKHQIRALLMLDFESAQFHNLTVIVTDGGLLKTVCMVVIEVEDSNDNVPDWEQEFYHFNTSPSADDNFIGRVLARDLDSTLNGEVKYKLKQKCIPFKVISSVKTLKNYLNYASISCSFNICFIF